MLLKWCKIDIMKNVILLGRTIQLAEITKAQLKGITIGDALSYTFGSSDKCVVFLMHC